ncbi:MAG: FeoA domain-containing protein [Balneolaceae bacterium]
MDTLLSEIRKFKKVQVKNITGADTTRLLEMGITPGVQIEIVRRAPLGFPMEIKVRGYLLSLREAEAKGIIVEDIK